MLTRKEVETLVGRIAMRVRPQKVIFFGSYAKGTATPKSDLDLFVIANTDIPFANRADEIKSLLAEVLIPIDIHFYTPDEVEAWSQEKFSFVSSVLRTGDIVFDKSQQVDRSWE